MNESLTQSRKYLEAQSDILSLYENVYSLWNSSLHQIATKHRNLPQHSLRVPNNRISTMTRNADGKIEYHFYNIFKELHVQYESFLQLAINETQYNQDEIIAGYLKESVAINRDILPKIKIMADKFQLPNTLRYFEQRYYNVMQMADYNQLNPEQKRMVAHTITSYHQNNQEEGFCDWKKLSYQRESGVIDSYEQIAPLLTIFFQELSLNV